MRGKFKLFSLFLFLAMIFSFFVSSQNVFADAPATTEGYSILKFTGTGIADISNVSDGTSVTVSYANGNTVTVTGTGLYSLKDSNNDYLVYYQLVPTDEITITANPSEGYISELKKDGAVPDYNDEPQARGVSFSIDIFEAEAEANSNMTIEATFRECKQIEIASHADSECKITSMVGAQGGNLVTINFENGNKITVERITEFGQLIPVEDLNGNGLYPYTDTSGETPRYFIRGFEGDSGLVNIKLLPTDGYSADLCVDGDFQHRGVADPIDEERKYEGWFRRNEGKYFLGLLDGSYFKDSTSYSSIVDISGTTPENPAVFKTYLLNYIEFTRVDESNSSIVSVRPIDVDQDVAAEVSPNSTGSSYSITFKSNYYDHAVFEITTADGNKYYIRIEREAFKITSEGEGDNKKVLASFYYPNDIESMNSCDNFDVVATKVKKDGTTEVLIVEPDSDKKDVIGGRLLRKSLYTVDVDDNVEGVYFTALRKGGTDAGQEEYAGTFSGSGRGIYYDLNSKQTRYDD